MSNILTREVLGRKSEAGASPVTASHPRDLGPQLAVRHHRLSSCRSQPPPPRASCSSEPLLLYSAKGEQNWGSELCITQTLEEHIRNLELNSANSSQISEVMSASILPVKPFEKATLLFSTQLCSGLLFSDLKHFSEIGNCGKQLMLFYLGQEFGNTGFNMILKREITSVKSILSQTEVCDCLFHWTQNKETL